ncbi:HIT domain-containing protein [Frankia sp. CcI49]|uniref:HIT family protein n=1 Tax=Frankia sp. CcI49 TaxID=1745382 RepID=UPI0013046812|nr:HIT domain-containing protein [Frankia sp. CcI49]
MAPEPCLFCDIIAGRAQAKGLRRYAGSVAFTPLNPATRGHTLVVPVRHHEGVWDVDRSIWQGLMGVVHLVSGKLRQELRPDGINIIQSTGEAATQTVPHLHIHVVPRYAGDAMGPMWPAKEVSHANP